MSRTTVYRNLRRRLTDTSATLAATITTAGNNSPISVSSALETVLQALWSNGPLFAQDVGDNIQFNCKNTPSVPVHVYVSAGSIRKHQATQCSWTAALIGCLVADHSPEAIRKIQRFVNWEDLSSATRDLAKAVDEAKKDAEQGKTTFLIVCVRDVGFQNQNVFNYDERYDYQSLTHYFGLGIDRDGWRIYMSFVDLYDLEQQQKRDTEKMDWKDMDIFLRSIDKLTAFKAWHEQSLCEDKQLVEVWDLDVFAMSVKDVKAENLLKFKWVL
ncbi:hypothetical protein MBLNU457_5421t1 [Dothideomycetes sp. NU457]